MKYIGIDNKTGEYWEEEFENPNITIDQARAKIKDWNVCQENHKNEVTYKLSDDVKRRLIDEILLTCKANNVSNLGEVMLMLSLAFRTIPELVLISKELHLKGQV